MSRESQNIWLLTINQDVVENLKQVEAEYGVTQTTLLTAVMEYIFNGESDLMDFLCDEYFTDSSSVNDLLYVTDCIQSVCSWTIESIADHYERIPTTFTVMSATVFPALFTMQVRIQDWR